MQGPYRRVEVLMHSVGRAHRVLKPMNDEADFWQMQHKSTLFRIVFFILKAKNVSNYKSLITTPVLIKILESSIA
jgi:hypothetical protein